MLNKDDIALLKWAKEKGLSVDEIIATAEGMLVETELINDLILTTNEVYYKMSPIIHRDVAKLKTIADKKEMIKTIVLTAFDEFTIEAEKQEAEKARLLKEEAERKTIREAEIKRISDEKLAQETKVESETTPETVEPDTV